MNMDADKAALALVLFLLALLAAMTWLHLDLQDQAVARGHAEWCGSVPDMWAWKGECAGDAK